MSKTPHNERFIRFHEQEFQKKITFDEILNDLKFCRSKSKVRAVVENALRRASFGKFTKEQVDEVTEKIWKILQTSRAVKE